MSPLTSATFRPGRFIDEIEGTISISVAGFASISGSFGIEKYTPTGSTTSTLIIGATKVNAVLGTASTNVTISNASLGLMIQGSNYALEASAGSVALNGVPDLTIGASGLEVKVEHGLNPATVTGAPTSVATPSGAVTLDFSGLSGLTGTVTEIEGTATINVANFVSLSGTFSFTEGTVTDADNKGTTTKILVGLPASMRSSASPTARTAKRACKSPTPTWVW